MRQARRPRALGLEPAPEVVRAVREGLWATGQKRLPAWLFYDDEGSRLFEEITRLDEYYLTRAEEEILQRHADDLARTLTLDTPPTANRVEVVELGAGSAVKTQLLLRALVRHQGPTRFVPVDVSKAALETARERLAREEPSVLVAPAHMQHRQALQRLKQDAPVLRAILFIGSSIGNFDDDEAVALLREVRHVLRPEDVFVLGVDRVKDPTLLLPAYDDARGVTAAFNRNVLARLNRELGATFELETFAHRARWNEAASRVEMHLESQVEQSVWLEALGQHISFRRGETIHTESSHKYDEARVDALLGEAGLQRARSFFDSAARFAVHLCRPGGAATTR